MLQNVLFQTPLLGRGRCIHSVSWKILQCRVQPLLQLPSENRQGCLALTLGGGLMEQSWAAVGATAHEGEREALGQVIRRPLDHQLDACLWMSCLLPPA